MTTVAIPSSDAELSWRLHELTFRVLYPFFFAGADGSQASEKSELARFRSQLTAIDFGGAATRSRGALWLPGLTHDEHNYTDKLLPAAARAVFGTLAPGGPATNQSRYLVLSERHFSHLFGPERSVILKRDNAKRTKLSLAFATRAPVELFLSEFGFGLLSMRFAAQFEAEDAAALAKVREAIYLASEIRPSIGLDLGRKEGRPTARADEGAPRENENIEDEEILGRASLESVGGESLRVRPLIEVLGNLVRPLHEPCGVRLASPESRETALGNLGVYAVIRARSVSDDGLAKATARRGAERLVRELSILPSAQHRGRPEDSPGVYASVFTNFHVAAASAAAAVHLVIDQPGAESYNPKRAIHALEGYFVPYLLALHQRWQAQHTLGRARAIVSRLIPGAHSSTATERDVADAVIDDAVALQREVLTFRVSADFASVSSNANYNAWYSAARAGLRAEEEIARIRDGLTDLNEALAARRGERLVAEIGKNVKSTRDAQRKIEWLEVILVTTYIVELLHILMTVTQHGGVPATSIVITTALAGFLLCRRFIHPDHAGEGNKRDRDHTVLILIMLCLPIAAWLAIWLWFTGDTPLTPGH